ncbi:MAG: HD domain-containing protein [Patescibacteria group bacterium]
MEKSYKKLWNLAYPYLKRAIRKNFVLHTQGVVKAMEFLLKKESGDARLLMPAAILHDTGWATVPKKLQSSHKTSDKKLALHLHIKNAPPIVRTILKKLNYSPQDIKKITTIIIAHKSASPKEKEKKLLIDADTLSDAFKKQFHSDIASYHTTPQQLLEFRRDNTFFTKTAKEIFKSELSKRARELKKLL